MAKNEQLIFGIHAVREALDAGKELDRVLLKRGEGSDLIRQLQKELRERKVPVQWVPQEKLNRITRKNHQGVVAWLSHVSYQRIESVLPMIYESGNDPFIIILDGISDVRNFGAIARTAECAGVHAMVIPASGSAAINEDAIKTSAGALHRMNVCRHESLDTVLRFLKESGLKTVAATEKAEQIMFGADLTGPVALVMGSEEKGISPSILRQADSLVSIPMLGKIASLNVSVAAGILMYECIRQRQQTEG